jgi:BlaI family penicillinase repressor
VKRSTKLGRVQLQIMEVLWRTGEATARQITESLAEQAPIAHSTVQTLLRKMEAKGAVAHVQQDRTFLFRPLIQQSEVAESAANDILSRVFHGSISDLVAHLIGRERVPPEELKRLRELIDSAPEWDNAAVRARSGASGPDASRLGIPAAPKDSCVSDGNSEEPGT